jgi:hypothetical protein
MAALHPIALVAFFFFVGLGSNESLSQAHHLPLGILLGSPSGGSCVPILYSPLQE